MWGWDHPSVPEGCRLHARKTYDYGVIHHLSDLTSRILACNEARAWDFVALATHLNEAQGAYRGSTGNTLVFMTFGSATLNSPQKEDKPDGSAS